MSAAFIHGARSFAPGTGVYLTGLNLRAVAVWTTLRIAIEDAATFAVTEKAAFGGTAITGIVTASRATRAVTKRAAATAVSAAIADAVRATNSVISADRAVLTAVAEAVARAIAATRAAADRTGETAVPVAVTDSRLAAGAAADSVADRSDGTAIARFVAVSAWTAHPVAATLACGTACLTATARTADSTAAHVSTDAGAAACPAVRRIFLDVDTDAIAAGIARRAGVAAGAAILRVGLEIGADIGATGFPGFAGATLDCAPATVRRGTALFGLAGRRRATASLIADMSHRARGHTRAG